LGVGRVLFAELPDYFDSAAGSSFLGLLLLSGLLTLQQLLRLLHERTVPSVRVHLESLLLLDRRLIFFLLLGFIVLLLIFSYDIGLFGGWLFGAAPCLFSCLLLFELCLLLFLGQFPLSVLFLLLLPLLGRIGFFLLFCPFLLFL
jgi:hypothetical protein